ncbi:MAG: ABC1 kinase family protein [Solirubrobacteraceae bacterium]
MSNHRERYRQVAETLARHGLGYLVGVVGLERWVPFQRGLLGHERRADPYTQPEHVRLALEQLGATFIKLGQILSTRSDLLGSDYQAELAKLQDAAPPIPGDIVRDLVAQELGRSTDEAFASFEVAPLAAGSIGQAHAATLHDGTEVVVKVRRPGIVEQIAEDLEILRNLAVHASRRWPAAVDYDLVGLFDEFAETLQAELDYLREGRSAERFATNFAQNRDVLIPRIFWETTTSRVLTLERVRGTKVNDTAALDEACVDRRAVAELATRVTAQMVFDDGFFHADPHPGNFFVEPDGRLGVIDFGMVGEIDEHLRGQLVALLVALARTDPDRLTDAVLALSTAQRPVDRTALRADLDGLVARNEGRTVSEIHLGSVIEEALGIVRRHHLQLPRELALLLKMVVMNEGMAATLDPDFRLGEVLGPYAQRLVARQLSPAEFARRLGQAGVDVAQLGAELPDYLRRLLETIDSGGFEVHLRSDELEPLLTRAERLGNRLVAGMIAAAFIDGLPELMAVDPERWRSWDRRMLSFGLGAAGTLGGYLAWSARRDRQRTSSGL